MYLFIEPLPKTQTEQYMKKALKRYIGIWRYLYGTGQTCFTKQVFINFFNIFCTDTQ